MEITYESIKDLVLNTRIQGNQIHCTFRINNSDKTIESIGFIRRKNTTKSRIIQSVRRNAIQQIRQLAYRSVRSFLGTGFAGRTGTSIVNETLSTRNMPQGYSRSEKREAIIEAYKKVAQQIGVNPQQQKEENLSPVEKQLAQHPVTATYDKEILARILVHLADLDNISREEKEELRDLVGDYNIDELSLSDEVSRIECEEVTPKVKESIYMLAWKVALVDKRLSLKEKQQLVRLGTNFGLSKEKITDITLKVKNHLLEQYFKWGTDITRSQLFEYADELELGHDDAERALIRYKKRNG